MRRVATGAPARGRWLAWAGPAAVGGLTLAAFSRSIGYGFLNWDDEVNFVVNPDWRGLGWANLRWMFTHAHTGHYIPLTWVTLGLNYALGGMSPWGYHLGNVVLHATNALLFYLLARRLLAAGFQGRSGRTARELGAATAALLFALHPLRVESVAWVTERRDLTAGLFALLAVLAWLRALPDDPAGRPSRGWRWTAAALYGAALLSKSTVVGLPVVLFVLDAYPLRRLRLGEPGWPARALRLGLVEKGPFLVLGLGMVALMLAVGSARGLLTPLAVMGPGARLAVSAYGLIFYLWKTAVPAGLSPLYTLIQPVDPWSAAYLVPAALVVALSAGLLGLASRWPAGLAAWLAYIALLFPVLGLLHNGAQIAADRYTYLACLPWALLGGAALCWCVAAGAGGRLDPRVARGAVAAAAVVALALGALTLRQVGVWRDSVTLWRHAASIDVESDIPLFYLGWALADAGRFDEARDHFERALKRVPDRLPALRAQFMLHLGLVEERAGRPLAAEQRYREALRLDPGHPVVMVRLGALLLGRGERAEAESLFARAAAQAPRWGRYQAWELRAAVARVPVEEREARGWLAYTLAGLLRQARALEEAEEQYRLAARLLPGQPAVWNDLGVTYALRGREAEALEAFLQALRVQPAYPDACANARRAAGSLRVAPPELAGCQA